MITSDYSRLPVERCIVLGTGEIKPRTLEETGRCLVPPGGSDDGSSKTISPSLLILITSGASSDQPGVTKGLHRAGSVVEGSYTVQGVYNTHSATPFRFWKGRFGRLLTTSDTLPAMPLNLHISPIYASFRHARETQRYNTKSYR